ncbi:MAG: hypothetical protein ABGZ53_07920 [Fuerstiella sp.]
MNNIFSRKAGADEFYTDREPGRFMFFSPTDGADVAETDQMLGRFKYVETQIGGLPSDRMSSGVTLAKLEDQQDGVYRFIVSMAFERQGPDIHRIRIVTLDWKGNALPGLHSAMAAAVGTKLWVLTFSCAFDGDHDDIDMLVVKASRQPAAG